HAPAPSWLYPLSLHDALPILAAQRRVVGMPAARIQRRIRISEQGGRVAGLAHLQRNVGEIRGKRRSIALDAVVVLVHPGKQRRARRGAWRALPEMPPEQNRVGRKRVEMRSLDQWISHRRQGIGAPMI